MVRINQRSSGDPKKLEKQETAEEITGSKLANPKIKVTRNGTSNAFRTRSFKLLEVHSLQPDQSAEYTI